MPLRLVAILAAVAAAMPLAGGPAAGGDDVLWDNGDWSTQNGIPHRSGQGQRRSVLDDFVIENAAAWSITSLTAVFGTWDLLGTDLEAVFYADRDGRPDFEVRLAAAQTRTYRETWLFGGCYGCPDVWEVAVTFDAIVLPAGRYWIDMHLVSPDPLDFQLITDGIIGSSIWADYEDYGGRQWGRKLFNAEYDVNFKLHGEEIIPAPGAAVLLAGAAIARRHRRR